MELSRIEELNAAFQQWMLTITWQQFLAFIVIGGVAVGLTAAHFMIKRGRRNGAIPPKTSARSR